jgi:hypothetical protein
VPALPGFPSAKTSHGAKPSSPPGIGAVENRKLARLLLHS